MFRGKIAQFPRTKNFMFLDETEGNKGFLRWSAVKVKAVPKCLPFLAKDIVFT
jgi:hypothetical protein